jgi:hypothetical protein
MTPKLTSMAKGVVGWLGAWGGEELARDCSVAAPRWPRRRCQVGEDGVATRIQRLVGVEGTCKV